MVAKENQKCTNHLDGFLLLSQKTILALANLATPAVEVACSRSSTHGRCTQQVARHIRSGDEWRSTGFVLKPSFGNIMSSEKSKSHALKGIRELHVLQFVAPHDTQVAQVGSIDRVFQNACFVHAVWKGNMIYCEKKQMSSAWVRFRSETETRPNN